MCVPILRSIGTKLMNLETCKKSYVLFDVTWRKNGMSYGWIVRDSLLGILISNILQPNQKSLRLPVKRLWLKQCF